MADTSFFISVASILKIFDITPAKDVDGTGIFPGRRFTSGFACTRTEPFRCGKPYLYESRDDRGVMEHLIQESVIWRADRHMIILLPSVMLVPLLLGVVCHMSTESLGQDKQVLVEYRDPRTLSVLKIRGKEHGHEVFAKSTVHQESEQMLGAAIPTSRH
ncbi:hypothetical protein K439DRAFT_1620949 [Ramaria rubella]|nr:hypothetical protein K439DRAFT_1620949 [Ramaria rubella]